MIGMGNAMPKDDNLILPFNSSLTYGQPNEIKSTEIKEILAQIESDLNELKEKKQELTTTTKPSS
jgi:hypothetical protein